MQDTRSHGDMRGGVKGKSMQSCRRRRGGGGRGGFICLTHSEVHQTFLKTRDAAGVKRCPKVAMRTGCHNRQQSMHFATPPRERIAK